MTIGGMSISARRPLILDKHEYMSDSVAEELLLDDCLCLNRRLSVSGDGVANLFRSSSVDASFGNRGYHGSADGKELKAMKGDLDPS